MLQLAPNGSLHLVHAVDGLPSPASPDDWAVEVMAAAETRLSEALRSTDTPASIHVRAGTRLRAPVSGHRRRREGDRRRSRRDRLSPG